MTEQQAKLERTANQPPRVSVPAYFGIGLIRVYQYTLSALIGRSCRHAPTCSQYTETAIRQFGLWAGGWMGLARISRCHPFGSSGYDPVPEELPETGRWYLPWRYGQWNGKRINAKS